MFKAIDGLARKWQGWRVDRYLKKNGIDVDQAEIVKESFQDGRYTAEVKYRALTAIAEALYEAWRQSGAENFWTIEFVAPVEGREPERFYLIMQRADGKTPAEKLEILARLFSRLSEHKTQEEYHTVMGEIFQVLHPGVGNNHDGD